MGFDEGQFVGSDVILQVNRLVLRHGGELANALADIFRVQVQALGDQARIGAQVAGGIPHQKRGEGGIIVDNGAAFTVENLAPGRQNGNIADAVLFRQVRVQVALRDLQPP